MWDINKITLTWSRKRPKNRLGSVSSFENNHNLQIDPKLLNTKPGKCSKFPGNTGESGLFLHLQLVLASMYIWDELITIKTPINGQYSWHQHDAELTLKFMPFPSFAWKHRRPNSALLSKEPVKLPWNETGQYIQRVNPSTPRCRHHPHLQPQTSVPGELPSPVSHWQEISSWGEKWREVEKVDLEKFYSGH